MELIITEKPSSAKKIAQALADGKPTQKKSGQVSYWELRHDGKEITVVSAVGHLYTVAEKDKKGYRYPVFSVEWVPSHKASKGAAFTKKYLDVIKKLAKEASEVTVATDFDIEGEVIGYNILRYATGREDGDRMKYSTVTVEDLRKSYQEKMDHIEWGQAKAGITRHELDWYYGINLSRALMAAIKAAGSFKVMSSGRVQGPALKLLADKEREITAFTPEPYWQLELHTLKLSAMHDEDKFWKKEEAEKAQNNVTGEASVASVNKKRSRQHPPNPFDLTTLQTEAYRSFRMSPKETLGHAQDLYSAGYISYPRTSSQQLPKEIGYEKVLKALKKQKQYAELADDLLGRKKLEPNNGKKTDPAHPAIYPTGEVPTKMRDRSKRVYDLVVRRFMATFGEPAVRETINVQLETGGEHFSTRGTRTVEPGWHTFYGPHVKQEEQPMPALEEGQTLKIKSVELLEKETQPPRRYTPSSIVRELEKRGLGTKATRADIIDNLFSRGYVQEESIEVSEIGLRTVETLEKYVPEILDQELTREIEEELEHIRAGDEQPEEVLESAKKHLIKLLDHFKEHEKKIGEELLVAERETRDARTILGQCPTCKDGELQIRRGRYGMFVGCTGYPDCKATYNLPKGAQAKPVGEECEECSFPLVAVKQKKRGFRKVCLNPDCPSKALTEAAEKLKEKIAAGEEKCPECEKPLSVRKSAYGEFIGCTGYPRCRYTQELQTKEDEKREKEKEESR